jgi:uncharacterized DUF497 family protein
VSVFEWDEAKSERNRIERGFDFAFAALIFEGNTIEREDTRRDYGEVRVVAIGQVLGITLTVVFTPRDDALRIISARRANRRERRVYEQATSE